MGGDRWEGEEDSVIIRVGLAAAAPCQAQEEETRGKTICMIIKENT